MKKEPVKRKHKKRSKWTNDTEEKNGLKRKNNKKQ